MSLVANERTVAVSGEDLLAEVCAVCGGIGFLPHVEPIKREYFQIKDGKPFVRIVESRLMEICPVCLGVGLVAS